MSYYVRRRLHGRLEHLERLVRQAAQSASHPDMSDEELADRLMRVLHMAEYIKAAGLDDAESQELLRHAARLEAFCNRSAAA